MPGAILVVDDDPVFRSIARRVLLAAGLLVAGEADSVATAMAVALATRPDAVMVDVGLPDGDGISLARELRALPWQPRVVLTSCDPDAARPADVRWSGAGAFIAKHELFNAPLERLLTASGDSAVR
jgi:DNA-binding NarL/FixJ family response regulator